jgi:hypothetical protein
LEREDEIAKEEEGCKKPPTVIFCKVLINQTKLVKLFMARGLQLVKVKLL